MPGGEAKVVAQSGKGTVTLDWHHLLPQAALPHVQKLRAQLPPPPVLYSLTFPNWRGGLPHPPGLEVVRTAGLTHTLPAHWLQRAE